MVLVHVFGKLSSQFNKEKDPTNKRQEAKRKGRGKWIYV